MIDTPRTAALIERENVLWTESRQMIAMTEHACQLERELKALQSETRDTTDVLVPRAFLEAARCPECDGSGFKVSTGPDPEQEQCQWCFCKHMILSGAPRA